MTDLKFDKKCLKKEKTFVGSKKTLDAGLVGGIKDMENRLGETEDISENTLRSNLVFLFGIFFILILVLIYSVVKLQVVDGERMYARSEGNQIKLVDIPARRGIIFDRDGERLVENRSVYDCFLNLNHYFGDMGVDDEQLRADGEVLEEILGDNWIRDAEGQDYNSIVERIYAVMESEPYIERVKIASDLDNESVLNLRSLQEEIPGVYLEEGVARHYPHNHYLAHVLGYTSIVDIADVENLEYVGLNDVVGRSGIEKYYDQYLFGEKGQLAIEVDALGQPVSENELLVKSDIPGSSLYLSVRLDAQKKAYELLEGAVDEYNAESAALILQDINTGEILTLSNYPSYDNNLFVEGITQSDFEDLLYADGSPLTNKAISSQVPPGSTFKSIVAAAAFDAGQVTRETTYLSKRGYQFSSGVPFREFQNNAYGVLNLTDALMLSSNIYFCEVIRNWDIKGLVPYLRDFGIGEYTGIDIPGEGPGRLPSPENKVELAKTTSPWLEPYWLSEGDSCNTVIGQGITTTTPIQAVNWTSAIANGGVLHTPHLGLRVVGLDGAEKSLEHDVKNENFISEESLEVVREGMRASVAGSRRVIVPLTDADVDVAAKTGTAEFGVLNPDGEYEHTHAWVTGFFPYDEPEYSFVVFLEDGGQSNNAARVARDFVDWFVSVR